MNPNQGSLTQYWEYARYDFQLQGAGHEIFNITKQALNSHGHELYGTFGMVGDMEVGAVGYCSAQGTNCGGMGVTSIYGRDFNETIRAMALTLSNTMRANADNSTTVTGRVNIPVYKIRWPWISAYFLAWTIFETRRHGVPIWKSSALPPLLYGAGWAEELSKSRYLGAMEKDAKQVMCHMNWPDRGEQESTILHRDISDGSTRSHVRETLRRRYGAEPWDFDTCALQYSDEKQLWGWWGCYRWW